MRDGSDKDVGHTVGIWIRVSTEDQAQGESPEHHLERAKMYAASRGWIVGTVYDLSGVSGKSVVEHGEAQRMLEDVKSGRIRGLIFSKLARLARNTRELLDFAEYFDRYGADLVSLYEAIDTSTPSGRLFYTMIAAMAQWEREEIADRVAASVPIRAKLGKNTGGPASFGYDWIDGKLEPHPEEAPVRKLIYELYLEHRRKKTVARLLNEQGFRTRTGAKFSDTTIDRLLRDPTAKGEHRANYTTQRSHKTNGKTWAYKPRDEWVIQKVEPVVSASLWAECNAILEAQAARRNVGPKGKYLFAGKTHCACGGKMYVKTGTHKFACGKCRNKMPVDDLEAVFRDEMKRFFWSEEDLSAFLANADQEIVDHSNQIETLKAEKAQLKVECDRIYRDYMDETMTREAFGELYTEKKARMKEIDTAIPQIMGKIDALKVARLSSEEVISGARDLYGRWDDLTFEDKVSIIEAIVEKIEIGERDIELSLHYVPSRELADERQQVVTDSSRQSVETGPDR